MAVRGAGGQAEASIVDVGKAFATIMLVHDPVMSRYDDREVMLVVADDLLLDSDGLECGAERRRQRAPRDEEHSEEPVGCMSRIEGRE